MSPIPASLAPAPAAAAPAHGRATPRWHKPAAAALALAGVGLAWQGGATGLVGALAVAAAGWLAWRAAAGHADAGVAASTEAHDSHGRHGAEVMVAQVVPVWSRQMEVTRDVAADGLARILEAFAEMTGAVETLTRNLGQVSLSAEPGAVDGAVRRESPALDALTSASARAFAERDAVVAELQRCADGLKELQHLAKQARELARHTRLVAFNASIEANRTRSTSLSASGNNQDGGAQAIAGELRMLAGRMADTGERVDRVVAGLIGHVADTRRRSQIHDTSAEELRLEIDLRARDALAALLGAVGGALHGAADVEQAGATLRDQLDAAFVHFQFGDRVSQMLNIVASDMTNFSAWVAANPHATQTDAAEWLAALEASYTMDEQRSIHHGNVVVDHHSGVDFF